MYSTSNEGWPDVRPLWSFGTQLKCRLHSIRHTNLIIPLYIWRDLSWSENFDISMARFEPLWLSSSRRKLVWGKGSVIRCSFIDVLISSITQGNNGFSHIGNVIFSHCVLTVWRSKPVGYQRYGHGMEGIAYPWSANQATPTLVTTVYHTR